MSLNDQKIKELHSIAFCMNLMQRKRGAVIHYHPLADAIYWSDEIPESTSRLAENLLRFVLRYRTTILLGKPEEKWAPYWQEALGQFPYWVGFSKPRISPSSELRQVIAHYRTKTR